MSRLTASVHREEIYKRIHVQERRSKPSEPPRVAHTATGRTLASIAESLAPTPDESAWIEGAHSMRLLESRASINGQVSIVPDVLRAGVWLLWHAVRVFMLGLLVLLEPVVRCIFGIAMYLGILASVIFEFSAVGPRFPFLAMLAASLACGLVLFLYYGLVAWLVR